MKFGFLLCKVFGHRYLWDILRYKGDHAIGLQRCTRCGATVRHKDEDWRTW